MVSFRMGRFGSFSWLRLDAMNSGESNEGIGVVADANWTRQSNMKEERVPLVRTLLVPADRLLGGRLPRFVVRESVREKGLEGAGEGREG